MTTAAAPYPLTSVTTDPTHPANRADRADLVVVGAGIVGLAHAVEAVRRGLRVTVVERDRQPVGASVRNFGHCCVTAQRGPLLDLAMRSRTGWLDAAARAGLWAPRAGALVVARSTTELAVLEELRDERGADAVRLRTRDEVGAELGRAAGERGDLVGGAHLPADLRVDPREAAPQLAAWLSEQPGARVLWGANVLGVEAGAVHTARGPVHGERVLLCVGHDLDRLYPRQAEEHGIERCRLSMARVAAPPGLRTDAAVLTATSMLRYDGFTAMPSAAALRAEVTSHSPELLDIGANVMCTRMPDGSVLVGDSHAYDATALPFQDEATSRLLLREASRVLGVADVRVTERWQGVYASSPRGPLLVRDVAPGVRAVSVTSGIGMTLSFGLAAATLDGTLPTTP